MDRVSVAEAARRLGVSQDAVYKRIKRGTIPYEKAEDDKTYVYIDQSVDGDETSTDATTDASTDPFINTVLVAELRNRVRFLEEELQRKDAILMSLVQRVPQLEPAQQPPGAPETAADEPGRVEPRARATEAAERPWWKRLFGER
jgi:uncharacterized small protein (DUF1192 family)